MRHLEPPLRAAGAKPHFTAIPLCIALARLHSKNSRRPLGSLSQSSRYHKGLPNTAKWQTGTAFEAHARGMLEPRENNPWNMSQSAEQLTQCGASRPFIQGRQTALFISVIGQRDGEGQSETRGRPEEASGNGERCNFENGAVEQSADFTRAMRQRSQSRDVIRHVQKLGPHVVAANEEGVCPDAVGKD